MANDFAALKTRIAGDLDRSDLSSEISASIIDAIEDLGVERFTFNQSGGFTLSVSADDADYVVGDWQLDGGSDFDSIIEPDQLWIRIGGNDHRLDHASWDDIKDMGQSSPTTGQPYLYAYFDDAWKIYPTPDQSYTIYMRAHYRLTELSDDSDVNAWTGQARRLTGAAAKGILYAEVLDDDRNAAKMSILVEKYKSRFLREYSKKSGSGKIQPTAF